MNVQILKDFFCIGLSFIILGFLDYILSFLPIWLANLFLIIGFVLCLACSIIYLMQTRKLSQPLKTSENERVSVPSDSNLPLICPKCGTKLKIVPVCPKCGFKFGE
jgi:hypothetical protein